MTGTVTDKGGKVFARRCTPISTTFTISAGATWRTGALPKLSEVWVPGLSGCWCSQLFLNDLYLWDLDRPFHDIDLWNLDNKNIDHLVTVLHVQNLDLLLNLLDHEDLPLRHNLEVDKGSTTATAAPPRFSAPPGPSAHSRACRQSWPRIAPVASSVFCTFSTVRTCLCCTNGMSTTLSMD